MPPSRASPRFAPSASDSMRRCSCGRGDWAGRSPRCRCAGATWRPRGSAPTVTRRACSWTCSGSASDGSTVRRPRGAPRSKAPARPRSSRSRGLAAAPVRGARAAVLGPVGPGRPGLEDPRRQRPRPERVPVVLRVVAARAAERPRPLLHRPDLRTGGLQPRVGHLHARAEPPPGAGHAHARLGRHVQPDLLRRAGPQRLDGLPALPSRHGIGPRLVARRLPVRLLPLHALPAARGAPAGADGAGARARAAHRPPCGGLAVRARVRGGDDGSLHRPDPPLHRGVRHGGPVRRPHARGRVPPVRRGAGGAATHGRARRRRPRRHGTARRPAALQRLLPRPHAARAGPCRLPRRPAVLRRARRVAGRRSGAGGGHPAELGDRGRLPRAAAAGAPRALRRPVPAGPPRRVGARRFRGARGRGPRHLPARGRHRHGHPHAVAGGGRSPAAPLRDPPALSGIRLPGGRGGGGHLARPEALSRALVARARRCRLPAARRRQRRLAHTARRGALLLRRRLRGPPERGGHRADGPNLGTQHVLAREGRLLLPACRRLRRGVPGELHAVRRLEGPPQGAARRGGSPIPSRAAPVRGRQGSDRPGGGARPPRAGQAGVPQPRGAAGRDRRGPAVPARAPRRLSPRYVHADAPAVDVGDRAGLQRGAGHRRHPRGAARALGRKRPALRDPGGRQRFHRSHCRARRGGRLAARSGGRRRQAPALSPAPGGVAVHRAHPPADGRAHPRRVLRFQALARRGGPGRVLAPAPRRLGLRRRVARHGAPARLPGPRGGHRVGEPRGLQAIDRAHARARRTGAAARPPQRARSGPRAPPGGRRGRGRPPRVTRLTPMEPAAVTEPAVARPGRWPRWLARAWRWWAARPVLSAAAIYALVSVVFVGQGLLPGRTLSSSDMLWSTAPWTAGAPPEVRWGGANFELADAVTVFHPFFQHARDAVPDVPLWNPHVMGGRPFLANAQSAVFSPFTWPAFVLPFWKSLAVMALLKLFVAALGTLVLGRALGMRFAGALLAGLVLAFGTFFVVWLAWPLTNIFPLLPWLLLLTELIVRRPAALPAAGLAGLVTLAFFGGHPETSFHVLVATVVFFAFRVLLAWRRSGRDRAAVTRPALAFGLALAGGTAIAAAT